MVHKAQAVELLDRYQGLCLSSPVFGTNVDVSMRLKSRAGIDSRDGLEMLPVSVLGHGKIEGHEDFLMISSRISNKIRPIYVEKAPAAQESPPVVAMPNQAKSHFPHRAKSPCESMLARPRPPPFPLHLEPIPFYLVQFIARPASTFVSLQTYPSLSAILLSLVAFLLVQSTRYLNLHRPSSSVDLDSLSRPLHTTNRFNRPFVLFHTYACNNRFTINPLLGYL